MTQPNTALGARGLARRLFAAAGACALAFMAASCVTAGTPASSVTQRSVTIQTPDGTADALLLYPGSGNGPWPAVLVWTDISGLRPAFADIGRDLADEGYVVLVPNAFYRSARIDGTATSEALSREQLRERTTTWTAATTDAAIGQDVKAYMAFVDALPQVATGRKAGTIGYNYGAPYAFRAATAMPDRFGAVVTLHPFRIATARPNSPHLSVSRSKAAYFIAIAQPDDEREPGDKDDLRKAFADAGLQGAVEVYPAGQGFAVPDSPAYDAEAAQAAWSRVLDLLRAGLD